VLEHAVYRRGEPHAGADDKSGWLVRTTHRRVHPTQSPTYTGAFNVSGASSSTTVKFRSWDYAGKSSDERR
jgi:hypothetical protein